MIKKGDIEISVQFSELPQLQNEIVEVKTPYGSLSITTYKGLIYLNIEDLKSIGLIE
jgi:hypothetical protein